MNQDIDVIRQGRMSGASDASRREIIEDLGSKITPEDRWDISPRYMRSELAQDDESLRQNRFILGAGNHSDMDAPLSPNSFMQQSYDEIPGNKGRNRKSRSVNNQLR